MKLRKNIHLSLNVMWFSEEMICILKYLFLEAVYFRERGRKKNVYNKFFEFGKNDTVRINNQNNIINIKNYFIKSVNIHIKISFLNTVVHIC